MTTRIKIGNYLQKSSSDIPKLIIFVVSSRNRRRSQVVGSVSPSPCTTPHVKNNNTIYYIISYRYAHCTIMPINTLSVIIYRILYYCCCPRRSLTAVKRLSIARGNKVSSPPSRGRDAEKHRVRHTSVT